MPTVIALDGNFSYDAIASGGRTLYLIEHRPAVDPTDYVVRAYDVGNGALREGIIVDKRTNEMEMEGYAISQTALSDGSWVYTAYTGGHHGPFVHALNTVDGYAFCVDLPRQGAGGKADDAWGLSLSRDETTLWAANGALGHVVEITAADARIVRAARLPVPAPEA